MKKIIIFIAFVLIIVISYVFLFNRKISYELEYQFDKHDLVEKFDIASGYYSFDVSVNDQLFSFMLMKKYSPKRKMVKDILVEEKEDYVCVSIKIDNSYLAPICSKDDKYYDSYIAGLNKTSSENKINTINSIEIYNKDHDYYIWNGYGITNVLTQKKYNFLNQEHYENDISYRFGKYIIFADYDASREYSKFYIFNGEKLEITEFEFDYKISTDSYFNGNINDDVYLFDRKNKKQYKININNKKISISSTNDYAIHYDGNLDEVALSDFVYSNIVFNPKEFINYSIKNDSLYYNYYDLKQSVLISKNSIKDIIYVDNSKIYYLVDDSLYLYDINKGEQRLLKYFEWNFSYKNKIFIFN